MTIQDILKKAAEGATLTDEEKEFVTKYDFDAEKNGAAAAARKAAEKERDEAKKKLLEATAALDELKAKAQATEDEKLTQDERAAKVLEAMQQKLATMEAKAAQAEAELKANSRKAHILAEAKKLGVTPIKNINEQVFYGMLGNVTKDVDAGDADALKAALEAFKTENAGMIATNSPGGIDPTKGTPSLNLKNGENPWRKEYYNLTKQIEISNANPTEAQRLKTEAGAA